MKSFGEVKLLKGLSRIPAGFGQLGYDIEQGR
jgi:hypothetical protein